MKTAQNTIRETSVYTCFVYNAEQRQIDPKHVRDIMDSMKTWGFLPSKPIQCYQDGKKFFIIDGHHRYLAAKNLQIPVLYVVEAKSHAESMSCVNGLQKPWQLKNYLNQYVKRGIESYRILAEYHELGFPISQAARMLSGHSAYGGQSARSSTGKLLRDGVFKIKTREKIEIIASFVREHGSKNPAFSTNNFIAAFELCLRLKDFEPERLTRKLANNPKTISRTANVDQMLDQIEEVYNWKQQIHAPLAFNAKQTRKR
jgi:hypothetical protein